jgi:hypothetical protein
VPRLFIIAVQLLIELVIELWDTVAGGPAESLDGGLVWVWIVVTCSGTSRRGEKIRTPAGASAGAAAASGTAITFQYW